MSPLDGVDERDLASGAERGLELERHFDGNC